MMLSRYRDRRAMAKMAWAVRRVREVRVLGYDKATVTRLGGHRMLCYGRRDGSASRIFSPEAVALVREGVHDDWDLA